MVLKNPKSSDLHKGSEKGLVFSGYRIFFFLLVTKDRGETSRMLEKQAEEVCYGIYFDIICFFSF